MKDKNNKIIKDTLLKKTLLIIMHSIIITTGFSLYYTETGFLMFLGLFLGPAYTGFKIGELVTLKNDKKNN